MIYGLLGLFSILCESEHVDKHRLLSWSFRYRVEVRQVHRHKPTHQRHEFFAKCHAREISQRNTCWEAMVDELDRSHPHRLQYSLGGSYCVPGCGGPILREISHLAHRAALRRLSSRLEIASFIDLSRLNTTQADPKC